MFGKAHRATTYNRVWRKAVHTLHLKKTCTAPWISLISSSKTLNPVLCRGSHCCTCISSRSINSWRPRFHQMSTGAFFHGATNQHRCVWHCCVMLLRMNLSVASTVTAADQRNFRRLPEFVPNRLRRKRKRAVSRV